MEIEAWIKTPECEEWLTKKLIEYEGNKLDKVLKGMSKRSSKLDPIYFTDNYPRAGCRLLIDVQEDKCIMAVHEPGGKVLEVYNPLRDEAVRYIDEWLRGIPPKRKSANQLQDQH